MPQEKTACRLGCGKMLAKGSVWTHEHKICPKRPGAGAAKVYKERQPAGLAMHLPRGKKLKRKTAKALSKMATLAAAEIRKNGNGHGCPDCLFRGLDSALAKELVTDAIRGGMHLEAACGFVRRALDIRGKVGA